MILFIKELMLSSVTILVYLSFRRFSPRQSSLYRCKLFDFWIFICIVDVLLKSFVRLSFHWTPEVKFPDSIEILNDFS